MKKFAPDFLLGAATAAHQVEGNNIHSDNWAQEHMEHTSFLEPSGDAVDHYHRYEEDIKLTPIVSPLSGPGSNRKKVNLTKPRWNTIARSFAAAKKTV